MNRIWKAIFPAIALLILAAAPARLETIAPAGAPVSKDLKRVLDPLQKHYHDTKSFTAKFNEEIATFGAPKRQRQGTVSFRKPGRMRWEVETPEEQTIVSDGETLYSYDPDLNQVVETPPKQALKSTSATPLLPGIGTINADF